MRQLTSIPGEIKGEELGLRAQLGEANDEILAGARRRGLGFSGIPVGEQAKYAATEFAPALARLRTEGQNRATTLESALAGLGTQDFYNARQMFEGDRNFAESKRQFNVGQANARSAAASQGAGYGNVIGELQSYIDQVLGGGTGGSGANAVPRSNQTDEADAAFLGNIRKLPRGEQTEYWRLLATSSNPVSRRRYGLAQELGFIGPTVMQAPNNSIDNIQNSIMSGLRGR